MTQTLLSAPIFRDAEKARAWLEARLWKEGPICPRCGAVDEATLMQGRSHRAGLYQCNICRQPFTITVGTPCEQSKIPLNKWLAAAHLLKASKKKISALQVGRTIGVSKKTAWFICHRIRKSVFLAHGLLIDGEGLAARTGQTYPARMDDQQASKPRGNRPLTKGITADSASTRTDARLVERGDIAGSSTDLRTESVTLVNGKSAKETAADGQVKDPTASIADSEECPAALDIGKTPSCDDEWIDLVSVIGDNTERDLLAQIRLIGNDSSRAVLWAKRTDYPDVAKTELKDAVRAIKNMATVLKTLDCLRHDVGQKTIGVHGSNTRAKKRPAIKKAVLAKSDRLLQEFLTQHIEHLSTARDHCRSEALSLRLTVPRSSVPNVHGKKIEPDKSGWEAKYSALANYLAAEAAKLLLVSSARCKRIRLIWVGEKMDRLGHRARLKKRQHLDGSNKIAAD